MFVWEWNEKKACEAALWRLIKVDFTSDQTIWNVSRICSRFGILSTSDVVLDHNIAVFDDVFQQVLNATELINKVFPPVRIKTGMYYDTIWNIIWMMLNDLTTLDRREEKFSVISAFNNCSVISAFRQMADNRTGLWIESYWNMEIRFIGFDGE